MPHAIRTQLAARAATLLARLPLAPRSLACGALVISAAALPAQAQVAAPGASTSLAPGARVRVSQDSAARAVGTVLGFGRDSLVVRLASGDTAAMALSTVRKIEISRGLRTTKLETGILGFVVGAGAGALVGAASYEPPPPCASRSCLFSDFMEPSRSTLRALGAVLGGAVGALAGALVGSKPSEAWQKVVMPDAAGRVSVVLPPRHRGPGVGVELAF